MSNGWVSVITGHFVLLLMLVVLILAIFINPLLEVVILISVIFVAILQLAI